MSFWQLFHWFSPISQCFTNRAHRFSPPLCRGPRRVSEAVRSRKSSATLGWSHAPSHMAVAVRQCLLPTLAVSQSGAALSAEMATLASKNRQWQPHECLSARVRKKDREERANLLWFPPDLSVPRSPMQGDGCHVVWRCVTEIFPSGEKCDEVVRSATHPLMVSASARSVDCCCSTNALPCRWINKKQIAVVARQVFLPCRPLVRKLKLLLWELDQRVFTFVTIHWFIIIYLRWDYA